MALTGHGKGVLIVLDAQSATRGTMRPLGANNMKQLEYEVKRNDLHRG